MPGATILTWNRDPARSRLARYCLYLSVAPLLGALLGGTVLFFTLLPGLFSNSDLLALVVLFVLVGGPFSLLYLWPLLTDADQRPAVLNESWLGSLRPGGLAVAAVAGLIALVGSLRVAAYGPMVVVGVCMCFGLPMTGLLTTRGAIDPETLTLRFTWAGNRTGGLDIAMRNWTALRQFRLGPVAVCLVSYAPGTGGGAPRLFSLPAGVARQAEDAFDRALATQPETTTRDGNPAVLATLVAAAVGALAVGVGLWWLVDLPPGIALYLLAFCLTLAALFLSLAARER